MLNRGCALLAWRSSRLSRHSLPPSPQQRPRAHSLPLSLQQRRRAQRVYRSVPSGPLAWRSSRLSRHCLPLSPQQRPRAHSLPLSPQQRRRAQRVYRSAPSGLLAWKSSRLSRDCLPLSLQQRRRTQWVYSAVLAGPAIGIALIATTCNLPGTRLAGVAQLSSPVFGPTTSLGDHPATWASNGCWPNHWCGHRSTAGGATKMVSCCAISRATRCGGAESFEGGNCCRETATLSK